MKAELVSMRRVGIGLAVAAALLSSACAAGQQAQTANQKETLDGTSVRIGSITLGGLAIESPSTVSYPAGSDLPVRVVIVNSGSKPDRLLNITSPGITGWGAYNSQADVQAVQSASSAATSSAGASRLPTPQTSVSIVNGGRASFGVPDSQRVLLLTGSKSELHPGMTLQLTFSFANNGTVTVVVPVQLSSSPQTSVIPGPSATGQQG